MVSFLLSLFFLSNEWFPFSGMIYPFGGDNVIRSCVCVCARVCVCVCVCVHMC